MSAHLSRGSIAPVGGWAVQSLMCLAVAIGSDVHAQATLPDVEFADVRAYVYSSVQTYCPSNPNTVGGCSLRVDFGLVTPGSVTCVGQLPPPCPRTPVGRAMSALAAMILHLDPHDPNSDPVGIVIDNSASIERMNPPDGFLQAEVGVVLEARLDVRSPVNVTIGVEGNFNGGINSDTAIFDAWGFRAGQSLNPGQYRLWHFRNLTGQAFVAGRNTIRFTGGSVGFGAGSGPTFPILPDVNGCHALRGPSAWVAAPVAPRLRVTVSEPPSPAGTRLASLTLPTELVDPVRVVADGVELGTFSGGDALNIGSLMNSSGASVVEIRGVRATPGTSVLPLWLAQSGQTATVCIEGLLCEADFNGVDGVSVQDIFQFLTAYFAGDPRTDFDGDGVRAPADIFAFLNAYFAGC